MVGSISFMEVFIMNIKEALVKLLKVKSIITLALIITFCILAFLGVITGEQLNNVVMMVVGFYFGTQSEKNANKSDKEE